MTSLYVWKCLATGQVSTFTIDYRTTIYWVTGLSLEGKCVCVCVYHCVHACVYACMSVCVCIRVHASTHTCLRSCKSLSKTVTTLYLWHLYTPKTLGEYSLLHTLYYYSIKYRQCSIYDSSKQQIWSVK